MENSTENESRELNDPIKSPYADLHLPPGLEEKTVAHLRQNNLLVSQRWYQSSWTRIAAMVILFMGGLLLGRQLNNKSVVEGKNEYLLLLYNPDNFIADNASQVKEYGQWLDQLKKQGELADGEELKEAGWLVNNRLSQPVGEKELSSGPRGLISGYFIIKAMDNEKALAIANSCPHLKYNGEVELREIHKHSN